MTKARSNAVAEAAKGDLSVGSGTNLAGILAVGNNGETLVADSSTSTGLRYSAIPGANLLANGSFDIWQRGTSGFSTNQSYCADRWFMYSNASSTVSQETSVIPTGATNALKFTTGTNGYTNLQYAMEQSDVEKLAGKTITFSVYLRANATYNGQGNIQILSSTTGNSQTPTWTAVSGATANHTPSTSDYTRVSVTGTVPTNAKGLAFYIGQNQVLASGSIYYIALAKVEIGSTPTTWSRLGGTIQGELAACQYYFYRLVDGSQQSGEQVSVMQAGSGNGAFGTLRWGNMMRVAPTFTVSSPAHYGLRGATLTGPFACSVISAGSISRRTAQMNLTTSTGGVLTAGNATTWEAISASATMDLSAEL